ncbi:cytochrome b5-like [Achroia grisella]|uniref:cytochrome b5-like n=1 Tax=Achroia grisella TaxID=688607 RepID=UPI0027D1F0EA|nr:cytochrome b5-like [Achroia grisella]
MRPLHNMADKKFTRKEIAERNSKDNAVFIIDNSVFDVTKFLDEHPGGHEVLLGVAGKDATEDFNDVGHSLDAKELMLKYKIGAVVDEDRVEVKKQSVTWTIASDTEKESSFVSSWKFPVLLGILATVLYTYLFG